MMRKVVEAKIGNSITGYENLWKLKLECGHSLDVPRRRGDKKPPPKKKDCRECEEKAQAETAASATVC